MSTTQPSLFLGIDVQVRRPCAYALLDADAKQLGGEWLPSDSAEAVGELRRLIDALGGSPGVAIGIDAPRYALPTPREWSWHRTKGWRPCSTEAEGLGRHCEIVIK